MSYGWLFQNNYNMGDKYIKISPDSIYYLDNNVIISGKDFLELHNNSLSPNAIEVIGTISIGFIIGWLLGFTNKYVDRTKINASYFTTIVGALLGAAVLGYFSNSSTLLGIYGTAVGVAFLIFSILYPIAENGNSSFIKKLINPNYKN